MLRNSTAAPSLCNAIGPSAGRQPVSCDRLSPLMLTRIVPPTLETSHAFHSPTGFSGVPDRRSSPSHLAPPIGKIDPLASPCNCTCTARGQTPSSPVWTSTPVFASSPSGVRHSSVRRKSPYDFTVRTYPNGCPRQTSTGTSPARTPHVAA